MRDVNPVSLFDLLLQMGRTKLMGRIGFEYEFFSSFIDWLRLSSGSFEVRIFPVIVERSDELVYPLTGNLELLSDLNDRFFL
jgi:aromatic ring-cleaving dioxygenase